MPYYAIQYEEYFPTIFFPESPLVAPRRAVGTRGSREKKSVIVSWSWNLVSRYIFTVFSCVLDNRAIWLICLRAEGENWPVWAVLVHDAWWQDKHLPISRFTLICFAYNLYPVRMSNIPVVRRTKRNNCFIIAFIVTKNDSTWPELQCVYWERDHPHIENQSDGRTETIDSNIFKSSESNVRYKTMTSLWCWRLRCLLT